MKAIKTRKTKTYDKQKIKAILIDSGRVLNSPVTGHWFITPNFFICVLTDDLNSNLTA